MLRTLLLSIVLAGTVLAQPVETPSFEVASVKAAERGGGGESVQGLLRGIKGTPGGLSARAVTLKACIAWAYHVFEYQVSGPGWLESDRYDIVAKAPGPTAEAEMRRMMQTLLADRFKVVLHRVTKEMQAYVLAVGKGGPKFHESTGDGDSDVVPNPKSMSIAVQRVPVSRLVEVLARLFQVPVVDTTGLPGIYDVTMNVAKYLPRSGEPMDPMTVIQTGLQEELGLKLEAKKLPIDLLIIDRAEKLPVEN